ncbi:MAG TPA: hypothetical protein VLM85_04055 [Polyangiaceae bacterium]|nr:hypothetical protein [Polyangiaceae bacterium]
MPRALKTGGDVDSWCTKCRLMLTHRIVAMVGPKPVRVECETCHSQHNFRERPPGDVAPKSAGSPRVVSSAGPRSARAPRATSATRLEQERREREQSWERAVSGKLVSDFVKYNVQGTFHVGDLIKHSKFGDGVVTRIIDAHKIEILFRDEPRTLAQALVPA